MASNKRCKGSRPRTAQDLARSPDIEHIPAARKARPARAPIVPIADEAEAVRRRIEHLECVITTAPAEHLARRIAMRDIVPPSEEHVSRNRQTKPRRRPMQAVAEARHRSYGLLVQNLALALAIVGLAGWLNQRFHFLPH